MSEPRDVLARAMTEDQLQTGVLDALRWAGWWTWHCTDPTMSAPGLPDVIAVHTRRAVSLFAELKTQDGRVRPAQRALFEAVEGHQPHTLWTTLWRPSLYDAALAWIVRPDGPPPMCDLPAAPTSRGPYPMRTRRRT